MIVDTPLRCELIIAHNFTFVVTTLDNGRHELFEYSNRPQGDSDLAENGIDNDSRNPISMVPHS